MPPVADGLPPGGAAIGFLVFFHILSPGWVVLAASSCNTIFGWTKQSIPLSCPTHPIQATTYRAPPRSKWLTMAEPIWSDNDYPTIDYQDLSYYSEPKQKEKKASLDEVDPELLKTFDKLGIPLNEQKRLANVAVDAVFDSVSIATTFREELAKVRMRHA